MYDEEHPESRAHAEQASSKENPLDFAFTGFVRVLEAGVRERILAAYERPFEVQRARLGAPGSNRRNP